MDNALDAIIVSTVSMRQTDSPICKPPADELRASTLLDCRMVGFCRLALVITLMQFWNLIQGGEVTKDQHESEQPNPRENLFEIMGSHGRIRGIIDWKGQTKVNVKPEAEDTIYTFDSEDLETYKKGEKPHFPTDMALIQADEQVFGYTEAGSSTYLWNEFNPDKG